MATTIVLKHYGKVSNGMANLYRKDIYEQIMKELDGKEFELTIKERSKKISQRAHGFYRKGIIGTCMKDEQFGGWDKDHIHEFFARKFLSYQEEEKQLTDAGETRFVWVNKIQSLSSLNSKEMTEFCDKVINWLATINIIILPPENYQ
jgi:hypothetical protein